MWSWGSGSNPWVTGLIYIIVIFIVQFLQLLTQKQISRFFVFSVGNLNIPIRQKNLDTFGDEENKFWNRYNSQWPYCCIFQLFIGGNIFAFEKTHCVLEKFHSTWAQSSPHRDSTIVFTYFYHLHYPLFLIFTSLEVISTIMSIIIQ